MSNEETKNFLNLAETIKGEIKKKREKVDELRAKMECIGGLSDSERVQNTPNQDKIGTLVAKVLDLEREIDSLTVEYEIRRAQIIDRISTLDNLKEQRVMTMLYIGGKKVYQVAQRLEMSESGVKHIHSNAINELTELITGEYLSTNGLRF